MRDTLRLKTVSITFQSFDVQLSNTEETVFHLVQCVCILLIIIANLFLVTLLGQAQQKENFT